MQKIKSFLDAAGIEYRPDVIRTATGENKPVLICNTDYEGPYPTAETFEKISTIRAHLQRRPAYKAEARGHYTAVFIYKA